MTESLAGLIDLADVLLTKSRDILHGVQNIICNSLGEA